MLTDPPALPPGLTTRPLRPSDATAVHELMAAQELADLGMVEIEEADIVADWARPSHDLTARSIGVFDGDRMVGYGELIGADRADSAVHPDWRGRGIGTWLAAWLRDLGRRVGSSRIGMPVPVGSPGDRLLTDLGYHVRWHSWVLQLPAGASVPDRPLPDGFTVRQARPEEYPALLDVVALACDGGRAMGKPVGVCGEAGGDQCEPAFGAVPGGALRELDDARLRVDAGGRCRSQVGSHAGL